MAAWTAQINSVIPSQGSITLQVTYYLATDTGFTTPLGTENITLPSSISAQNAQAQIVASGKEFRSAQALTATYNGTTVNIP